MSVNNSATAKNGTGLAFKSKAEMVQDPPKEVSTELAGARSGPKQVIELS